MSIATNATLLTTLQKLYATNVTAASITAPASTLTKPSGDGIVNCKLLRDSASTGNAIRLFFWAVGTANDAFTARVTRWDLLGSLWIPTPLYGFDLTVGTAVGVATGDVLNTEKFVDTIAATSGLDYTAAAEIISKGDNLIAWAKLDTAGAELIQVQLAKGNATSVNGAVGAF